MQSVRRTNLIVRYSMYKRKSKGTHLLLENNKDSFLFKIIPCGKNPSELFKIATSFLGESSVQILPDCTSALE